MSEKGTSNWIKSNKIFQKYALKRARSNVSEGPSKLIHFLPYEESSKVSAGCCWFADNVWRKLRLRKVLLVLLLASYTFAGGAMFYYIEHPFELRQLEKQRFQIFERHGNFSRLLLETAHSCNANRKTNCTELFLKVLKQYDSAAKIDLDERIATNTYNWSSFWNAVWYCTTIYTTIGYGNLAPATKRGKLATIFYGLIGIPLMLVFLKDLGQSLYHVVEYCHEVIYRGFFRLVRRPVDSDATVHFPLKAAFLVVFVYVFLCALIQMYLEEGSWGYLDSFYFFFITFSTIGLGDVMPDSPKIMIYTFALFLAGLALVAMIINMINVRLEDQYFAAMDLMEKQLIREHEEDSAAETDVESNVKAEDR